MIGFRTKQGKANYKQKIKEGILKGDCNLCAKPSIVEFKYWKIVKNKFPYDAITKIHDVIQTINHLGDDEITDEGLLTKSGMNFIKSSKHT